MTEKTIYEFNDYKSFLISKLGGTGRRTGARKALATHLGCQTAYLSQVLNGPQNLSIEQAYNASDFFGFSPDEMELFMLRVQVERAGTKKLQDYYLSKIDKLLEKRMQIKSRLSETKTISENDKSKYYSHWLFSAVHMMVSIPDRQTREGLLESLKVSAAQIDHVLEFLVDSGLVQFDGSRYIMGKTQIHLANDDESIQRHHQNWRLQALQSIERGDLEDLHYSVCFSIAKKDVSKIKDRIIRAIRDNLKDIEPSKEEILMCNVIDLFEVK